MLYKINSISNKDIQYIGQAKNIEQYVKRFIEIVKDNVLKNVSDINSIKFHPSGDAFATGSDDSTVINFVLYNQF